MHRLCALLGLLALVIVACGSSPPTVMPPTPTPTPEPPLIYIHPEGFWRISYPRGWTVEDPQPALGREGVELEGVEVVSFTYSPLQWLSVVRYADTSQDLLSFSTDMLNFRSSEKPSFQLMSWEQVNLGEYPAYEAVYAYTVEGGDSINAVELHLIVKEEIYNPHPATREVGYIVSGVTADSSLWDDHQELLRQLVYSFWSLKGSQPPSS